MDLSPNVGAEIVQIHSWRKMDRQDVTSTNIRSIGYDNDSGMLEVEFHNGGIYQYLNVPELVYAAMMSASSKGSYLNSQIKKQYEYKKIR